MARLYPVLAIALILALTAPAHSQTAPTTVCFTTSGGYQRCGGFSSNLVQYALTLVSGNWVYRAGAFPSNYACTISGSTMTCLVN